MATTYKLTADGPEVSKEEFDAYLEKLNQAAEVEPPSEAPDQDEE